MDGHALTPAQSRTLFCEAEKYLGSPYVWGGSSPETGFDCSGLICWVYQHTGLHELPRLCAQSLYFLCQPIDSFEKARPGDLIFFTNTYDAGVPITHIGILAGNGNMLHCSREVKYSAVSEPYWKAHYYGIGRLAKRCEEVDLDGLWDSVCVRNTSR